MAGGCVTGAHGAEEACMRACGRDSVFKDTSLRDSFPTASASCAYVTGLHGYMA